MSSLQQQASSSSLVKDTSDSGPNSPAAAAAKAKKKKKKSVVIAEPSDPPAVDDTPVDVQTFEVGKEKKVRALRNLVRSTKLMGGGGGGSGVFSSPSGVIRAQQEAEDENATAEEGTLRQRQFSAVGRMGSMVKFDDDSSSPTRGDGSGALEETSSSPAFASSPSGTQAASASASTVSFSTPEELIAFEATARTRKQDSFLIRIHKLGSNFLTTRLQQLFYQYVGIKRLDYLEIYEGFERRAMHNREERSRFAFLVYIDFAKIVDEARHHIMGGEMIALSNFQLLARRQKDQYKLENDFISSVEELFFEYYGWMMWYCTEHAYYEKQYLSKLWAHQREQLATVGVVEVFEVGVRGQLLREEQYILLLKLSDLFVASFSRIAAEELYNSQLDLKFEYDQMLGPLCVLRRAWMGYKDRKQVAKLHFEDLPYRARRKAAKLLHEVARGHFSRTLFHYQLRTKGAKRKAAVRLLHRVVGGYWGRYMLVCHAAEQIIRSKERFVRDTSQIHFYEKQLRQRIESEEAVEFGSQIRRPHAEEIRLVAIGVLHRVMRGFVCRVDTGLFKRYGVITTASLTGYSASGPVNPSIADSHGSIRRNSDTGNRNAALLGSGDGSESNHHQQKQHHVPVNKTIGLGGSHGYSRLSRALEWHLLAARHKLWEGVLFDVHFQ